MSILIKLILPKKIGDYICDEPIEVVCPNCGNVRCNILCNNIDFDGKVIQCKQCGLMFTKLGTEIRGGGYCQIIIKMSIGNKKKR